MSTRSDIDCLATLAGDFAPEAVAGRLVLIARLARAPLRSAPLLRRFHSLLLHALAFPDDADTLVLVQATLAQFPHRIAQAGPAARRALLHSGIAGTRVDYPFAHVNARFLAARWPGHLHIHWGAFDSATKLDPLLLLLCSRNELQVFDDATLGTAAWMRLAMDGRRGSEPAWLFRQCADARLNPAKVEILYNEAEVPVRWQLSPDAARTGNTLDTDRPVFRTSMRKLPADAPKWIKSWQGPVRHVPEAEGRRIIGCVQAALLVRCREVFAHQNADPADVYRVDLGAGAEVVFLGSLPARRLGLEANYGYMIFSNGVPLGYGGVTSLLGQGNTGLNIFEEFRRGESAYLYAAVLGAARLLFGCERFIVNPYQFGADNSEAIRSGAFWFYYRLGFRPVDAAIRVRAERECARLAARRGARTSAATLREFTRCDLELVLPGYGKRARFEERWLGVLAQHATAAIARAASASRSQGIAKLAQGIAAMLEASLKGWSRSERAALLDLAPVLTQIPHLERWPVAERHALVGLVRARGAVSERRFAELTARHLRLRRALARAAYLREDRPG